MPIHDRWEPRGKRVRGRSPSDPNNNRMRPGLLLRTRWSIERFLGSAVPAPEPIFPDSPSSFAQFPTLSFLDVRRTGSDHSIWDQAEESVLDTAQGEMSVRPDRVSDAWFRCRPDK